MDLLRYFAIKTVADCLQPMNNVFRIVQFKDLIYRPKNQIFLINVISSFKTNLARGFIHCQKGTAIILDINLHNMTIFQVIFVECSVFRNLE